MLQIVEQQLSATKQNRQQTVEGQRDEGQQQSIEGRSGVSIELSGYTGMRNIHSLEHFDLAGEYIYIYGYIDMSIYIYIYIYKCTDICMYIYI